MTSSMTLLESRDRADYLRLEQAGSKCDECDASFRRPILATVSSSGHAQTYYACPRCLTELAKAEEQEENVPDEEKMSMTGVNKSFAEFEEVKCEHFLGYLKNRPKNTPIPEDCLTCSEMIKCILH